jgi:GNAT superfamily N-acetyltransferase
MDTSLASSNSDPYVSDVATATVCIRRAEIGDACVLAILMTQLGYPTIEDEMRIRLEEILPSGDYLVAVALSNERVVGVIGSSIGHYLEMNGRYGRVNVLSVEADHRSHSIGGLLLAHSEKWLRSQGAAACIVNSGSYRTGAHRFYEQNGYEVTGLRFFKKL